MSLRINHNVAALNAHRNLQNTMGSLSKSMQRLSSGYRINRGADDPAGLVISEQFRAQIAGLNRAIGNSEGSISMIQTAEGALTEISSLLISMRELAIHAANEGFNDADQLAADQAEINNAMATIDRIAAHTQFGTKKLIDGTKDNIATITSGNTSNVQIKTSYLSNGTHSISATKQSDSTSTLNTTSLGLSLTNTDGDPSNLTEGIHNIDVLQASDVAKKSSNAISMSDAWGNGLELAAAGTVAMVSSAVIATATASNAGTYTFVVNYQENGESPVGNQSLTVNVVTGETTATLAAKLQAAVNLNTGLAGKVAVTGTAAGALRFKSVNKGAQYSVRTEVSTFTGTTGTPLAFVTTAVTHDRGASKNLLSLTVNTATNSNVTHADVTIGAATYTSLATLATAIDTALDSGTGNFGRVSGDTAVSDVDAAVWDTDKLRINTNDEGSDYNIKMNQISTATEEAANVLGFSYDSLAIAGTDALVSFDNYTNTITSVKYGTTSSVTLANKATGATGRGTVKMTTSKALTGINVGNLLLDVTAAKFNVRLDGGPAHSVSAGVQAQIYNADRTSSLTLTYNLTSQGGTETINNTDRSLVFQIGANVGQTARVGLRGMNSSQLGMNIAGNMFLNLSEVDVTSVAGAEATQALIDAAINEVSTTRGMLGSFQKNTLESNLRNLRVAAQNLTASESQIRDTDMAAEMSEFTKNQILVQAGTAMLAQANQAPQVVLQLFG